MLRKISIVLNGNILRQTITVSSSNINGDGYRLTSLWVGLTAVEMRRPLELGVGCCYHWGRGSLFCKGNGKFFHWRRKFIRI